MVCACGGGGVGVCAQWWRWCVSAMVACWCVRAVVALVCARGGGGGAVAEEETASPLVILILSSCSCTDPGHAHPLVMLVCWPSSVIDPGQRSCAASGHAVLFCCLWPCSSAGPRRSSALVGLFVVPLFMLFCWPSSCSSFAICVAAYSNRFSLSWLRARVWSWMPRCVEEKTVWRTPWCVENTVVC